MNRLFLTFDYEIFFAESGTVERSLLEPTMALSNLLKRWGITATFFVDVLYLERLAREDPQGAGLVTQQLRALIANGHRLELHLHPHWLDAVYHSGTWHFPSYTHYRLHSLHDEEIRQLFISGIDLIERIAQRETSNYKVTAFRGGGWCIQPFSRLLPAFRDCGLCIDSSIGYGMGGTSPTHAFDFTTAPNKRFYRFADDPLHEDSEGTFFEAAVTTYFCPPHWRLHERLERYLKNCAAYGDGRGLRTDIADRKWTQIMEVIRPRRRFLSLDGCYGYSALKVLDGREDAVLVSHPKLISPYSLTCLEKLVTAGRYRFALLTPSELDKGPIQDR